MPQPLNEQGATIAPHVEKVRVLAGGEGRLADALANLGVTVGAGDDAIFIDGANPPPSSAKSEIDRALSEGRLVFVWGARDESLPALNALLPRPLALTKRTASSLVASADPLTNGMTPASLYFSELNPPTILASGLGGPLVEGAKVLLSACDTDWMRWNGQGETVKTAMVLRSEREPKPSGAALIEVSTGTGRLIVCGLSPDGASSQAIALNRAILRNLGVVLGEGASHRNLLGPDGTVNGALYLGPFRRNSDESRIRPGSEEEIVAGSIVGGRTWRSVSVVNGGGFGVSDVGDDSVGYFSFWVFSPKDLENLLLDPHLPSVGLRIDSAKAARAWLGAQEMAGPFDGTTAVMLKQGWNHILVKMDLVGGQKERAPGLHLTASQPDFLGQLRVAMSRGR